MQSLTLASEMHRPLLEALDDLDFNLPEEASQLSASSECLAILCEDFLITKGIDPLLLYMPGVTSS